MKSDQVLKRERLLVIRRCDGPRGIEKNSVYGYSFRYQEQKWLIYFEEKAWKIIDTETGYEICREKLQGAAILKFVKYLNAIPQNIHGDAIIKAREELKEAGIDFPVNK